MDSRKIKNLREVLLLCKVRAKKEEIKKGMGNVDSCWSTIILRSCDLYS
jgi:hypothetical protein